MFNALRREIEEILGEDFAVFTEYNTNPRTNDEILNEYKNVGVLYVNYGDLKLLPGNQGLTGKMQLDLLMSVKDGTVIEDCVSKPLYNLMENQNGKFYPDGEANGQKYSYVLNYHLPTSTGEEKITAEGVRYVVYSLPIDVTLVSTSLVLGEQFEFRVSHGYLSGRPLWPELKNVVTAVISYKLSLDPHTIVNGGNVTKSSATAKVWGMHVECLYDAKNKLHKAIKDALENETEKVWDVEYKLDTDDEYQRRKVLFHDSTLTFERGQFAVLVLNMCEAG